MEPNTLEDTAQSPQAQVFTLDVLETTPQAKNTPPRIKVEKNYQLSQDEGVKWFVDSYDEDGNYKDQQGIRDDGVGIEGHIEVFDQEINFHDCDAINNEQKVVKVVQHEDLADPMSPQPPKDLGKGSTAVIEISYNEETRDMQRGATGLQVIDVSSVGMDKPCEGAHITPNDTSPGAKTPTNDGGVACFESNAGIDAFPR